MRILIVGADTEYAIERPYIRYLSEIEGNNMVSFFRAQNYFLTYYKRSIIHKILYRAGLSDIIVQINLKLRRAIEEFKPDVVWVFKGMEVLPETILWVKGNGIRIVNYNPDNPFFFSGRGSGNSNVSKSIGLYDLHFTYDTKVKKKIEEEFGINCVMLPFGFELSDDALEKTVLIPEVLKACFLGTADAQRAEFIDQLADNGVSIDVYGNGWRKYITNPSVGIFDAVYGDNFWMTLRKYRVQLNLMRPHNPNSHNMRTFEVPGVGGIELAPDTPDHRAYFEVGKDIFAYRGVTDCVNTIEKLITMSFDQANKIRKAARDRSLLSGYTYKDRARKVFNELKKLVDG
jgi:spore maturation protein CgeB